MAVVGFGSKWLDDVPFRLNLALNAFEIGLLVNCGHVARRWTTTMTSQSLPPPPLTCGTPPPMDFVSDDDEYPYPDDEHFDDVPSLDDDEGESPVPSIDFPID